MGIFFQFVWAGKLATGGRKGAYRCGETWGHLNKVGDRAINKIQGC